MIARSVAKRFPQIEGQRRCSSGYTYVPPGASALPPGWGSSFTVRPLTGRHAVPEPIGLAGSLLRYLTAHPPGMKLPKRRAIGVALGCGIPAVTGALDELQHLGLISFEWLGKNSYCDMAIRVHATGVELRTDRAMSPMADVRGQP
ncbi:helix-turn-helix domain-containing protein [Granulibacter bethesdensis]|nr:hypothetical protein [Granulibacter bethesdensis]